MVCDPESLQRLLNHAHEAVIAVDTRARITVWNTAAEHLLGWSRTEALGQPLLELLVPREQHTHHVLATTLEGTGNAGAILLHRGGQPVPVNVHATTVAEAPGGGTLYFIHRAPPRGYRTLFDRHFAHTPNVAVQVYDIEGKVLAWNTAAEHIFGYRAEEALGRTLDQLILGPEDTAEFHAHLREMARTGEPVGPTEWGFRRQDGGMGVIYSTAFPVLLGEHPAFMCMDVDITARVEAERERDRLLVEERTARRDSERARRAAEFLSQTTHLLTTSLDLEGTLRTAVRAAVPDLADWAMIHLHDRGEAEGLALTSWRAEEHAEPHLCRSQMAVPSILRATTPALQHDVLVGALREEAQASDEEACSPAWEALEQLQPASALVLPITLRGHRFGALLLASTRQRRFDPPPELQLAQDFANACALAIENARLYRAAQDTIRLREEFLSIASHELKTPLTALSLQVQVFERMLRSGQRQLDPARAHQIVEHTHRQLQRFESLVNDLLDVSRITSGRLILTPETVDLSAVVRDIVAQLSDEVARSGSQLHLSMRAAVGTWDRLRMEQVITNLLSNAIKYGGGNRIDILLDEAEGLAHLAVRDHGIGIPSEDQGRIFDRFERATPIRSYGGLGLGLYIVRRIVEAHGGTIDVVSEPGAGSTFTVHLPAHHLAEHPLHRANNNASHRRH